MVCVEESMKIDERVHAITAIDAFHERDRVFDIAREGFEGE